MQMGMIHRIIGLLQQAFLQLDVQVALERVEFLAVIIHKAMTVQTRNFHNLEHVFNFVDVSDPVQTMAALFHDLVYYQVDLGFLPEIRRVIDQYIIEDENGILLREMIPSNEHLVWMTMEVFDLRAGERLSPFNGLNEFLSAIVMNKQLEGFLQEKDLLRMTLCIEATIPFRGLTPQGESHFDVLSRRLCTVAAERSLPFTDQEVEDAIQLSVKFANKDVENFSELDAARFLDNTWKLLPEMNIALRSREVYTVREYRIAIQKMEAFLSTLDPNNVFHSYHGAPSEQEFDALIERAHKNIFTARQYLRVKLLAQAILDALAEQSGGDAPLCLFMGDLPKNGDETQRMEDFLPDVNDPYWADPSTTVYQLFEGGRQGNSSFDLRTAPLSRFLFKSLPPEEFDRSLKLAKEMFSGRLRAHDFLTELNPHLVSSIARACARTALTRTDILNRYTTP